MSSLPCSFFTSAAMPASKRARLGHDPQKTAQDQHEQCIRAIASVEALRQGAVATSATSGARDALRRRPHDMITVMIASAMSMMSRMVNDDIEFALLLSFLGFRQQS